MQSTDSGLPRVVHAVQDVLVRPGHWTAVLPATLRQIGVADLLGSRGLDFQSYGTARMMAGSAREARRIVGEVDAPDRATDAVVLVERLHSRAVAELGAVGLSLGDVDDSTVWARTGVLRRAWHFVHSIWPELSSSIGYLVRCVHLLKAPSPALDCSYSRPDWPFSIFLSVPDHGARARIERVTEALVHETMHLQLSLIEHRIRLVDGGRAATVTFSPWRGSERNVRGVLHALYVFVVVQKLWQRATQGTPIGCDREFAEARVYAIREEVAKTQHLAVSPGLSRQGRQLVQQLLALGRESVGDTRGPRDVRVDCSPT